MAETTILEDNAEYQRIRTVNDSGSITESVVWKSGTTGYNREQMLGGVEAAITRCRQIRSQADTFQAQANYATANLANLNDLLAKTKTVSVAVEDLALYVIQLARLVADRLDAAD